MVACSRSFIRCVRLAIAQSAPAYSFSPTSPQNSANPGFWARPIVLSTSALTSELTPYVLGCRDTDPTSMSRWILGLGGSDHDFSAALMCDGDIRVAIEQERLSRRKYGKTFWFESPVQKAIDYCLAAEDICMNDVSAIVFGDTFPARVRHDLRSHDLYAFPHHLCHAASAYMMLPRGAKAGILVYDGFGSVSGPAEDEFHCKRETFSFFLFHSEGHERLGRNLGTATVE